MAELVPNEDLQALQAWKNILSQIDRGALNTQAQNIEKQNFAKSTPAPELKRMTEEADIPTGARATRIDRVNALHAAGALPVPRYAELGPPEKVPSEAEERIATLTATVAELQRQVEDLKAAKTPPAQAISEPAHQPKSKSPEPAPIPATPEPPSSPTSSVAPAEEKPARKPTFLGAHRNNIRGMKEAARAAELPTPKSPLSATSKVPPPLTPTEPPPPFRAAAPKSEIAPAPMLSQELLAAAKRALDNLRNSGATMIKESSLRGMLAKNGKPSVSDAECSAVLAEFEKQGLVGPINIQTGWRAILDAGSHAENTGPLEIIKKPLAGIEAFFSGTTNATPLPNGRAGEAQKESVPTEASAVPMPTPIDTPPPAPPQAPDNGDAGHATLGAGLAAHPAPETLYKKTEREILEPELAAAPVPHKLQEPVAPHLGEVVSGNNKKTDEPLADAWEDQAGKTEQATPRLRDIVGIAERPGWTAEPWERRVQKAEAAMAARKKTFEAEGQQRPVMARLWKAARRIGLAALILGGLSTATQNDHRPVTSYTARVASPALQRVEPKIAVPEAPQSAEGLAVGSAIQNAVQESQDATAHTIEGEHLGYQFPTLMEMGPGQTAWDMCVDWAKNVTDNPSEQIVLGDALSKIVVEQNPTVNFEAVPAGTEINTSFLNSPEVQRELAQAMKHWESLSDKDKAAVFTTYLKAKSK